MVEIRTHPKLSFYMNAFFVVEQNLCKVFKKGKFIATPFYGDDGDDDDGDGDDVDDDDDDDDDDDAAHLYSFNILFIDCVQKGILRLHLNVIILSWLQIRRIWPK